MPIIEASYYHHGLLPNAAEERRVDIQQLGLLFIVLALGATHNLELAQDDPISEELCSLAKCCLAKGQFMTRNTLAGVQTLVGLGRSVWADSNRI